MKLFVEFARSGTVAAGGCANGSSVCKKDERGRIRQISDVYS
jgi:hypothetical protein